MQVHEKFQPVPQLVPSLPSSIAWTLTVIDANPAPISSWRTTIASTISFGAADSNISDVLYWAPRDGDGTGSGKWVDTLSMLRSTEATAEETLHLSYGDPRFLYEPDLSRGRAIMPIPVTVCALASRGAALALLHDPRDALISAYADVNATSHIFSRVYNRLGAGAAPLLSGRGANFTTYIIPLGGADWRGAFAYGRAALPDFFLPSSLTARWPESEAAPFPPRDNGVLRRDMNGETPQSPLRTLIAQPPPDYLKVGMGMYTCASDGPSINATFLAEVGGNIIWDASFFWPYQGLFLPPNVSWMSNMGADEETKCGTWKHGLVVDRAVIAASYQARLQANTTTLSYFNLFHFGKDAKVLPPQPATTGDWVDSSAFVAAHFPASVLQPVIHDWQGSIVLDPGEPLRKAFLQAQTVDKLASFGPLFGGLSIDETNPAFLINFNRSVGDICK